MIGEKKLNFVVSLIIFTFEVFKFTTSAFQILFRNELSLKFFTDLTGNFISFFRICKNFPEGEYRIPIS